MPALPTELQTHKRSTRHRSSTKSTGHVNTVFFVDSIIGWPLKKKRKKSLWFAVMLSEQLMLWEQTATPRRRYGAHQLHICQRWHRQSRKTLLDDDTIEQPEPRGPAPLCATVCVSMICTNVCVFTFLLFSVCVIPSTYLSTFGWIPRYLQTVERNR